MTTIIIEGDGPASIVTTTDIVGVVVQVGAAFAAVYTRAKKTVAASAAAVAGDEFKLIELDGSAAAVIYTIDPALFTGMTMIVRSKDDTLGTTVAQSAGNIELMNGENQTSVQLLARESIDLYSDGVKLVEV